LVLVLVILSSMTILTVGLAYRSRIEIKLAKANAERIKVYYMALGGIERIKGLLSQKELTPERISFVSQFKGNVKGERLFEQLKGFPHQTFFLGYLIKDELGYLNVNQSDPAIWQGLNCIDTELISCILDWIDSDNDTKSDGAETEFYRHLRGDYNCKNSPCQILKELLFVKSINQKNYLPGHLSDSSKLMPLQEQGQQSFFDDYQNSKDLGFLNVFTVLGDGNINVNTVSQTILSLLPGLDEQAAMSVINFRNGPDCRAGTSDDNPVTDAEAFSEIEGLSDLQAELLEQYCCFESEYFRLFSYAASPQCECLLMATARIIGDKPHIVCIERLL
jgi:type II secretory pathway component PulK